MVIILQQTTDNGNRFVSTVVEEESSFTSQFSVGSQNSISERSAIYKQRIDSLFGRHSRLNSFKPNVEPFCIRIEGTTPTTATPVDSPTPSSMTSNTVQPLQLMSGQPTQAVALATGRITKVMREDTDHILSSDDDDYQKIADKSSSVITDSLNNNIIKKCTSTVNINGGTSSSTGVSHNVSSVRITCEDIESRHHGILVTSSGEETGKTGGSHMWRNGAYGESPCVEEKAYGIVRNSPGGILRFPVEYLGSVPVDGTTTALQDLQVPLRALYLDFLTGKNVMSGQLAITADGLRFEAPKIRLVNPFTTIAVWAAIKFVARGEPKPTECAFMPLISDPEGQDKGRLFGKMDSELAKVYLSCVGGSDKQFRNPPIFACVMREATFSLDCHAFACKCAEDAIVVAANLYQSLVDKMRAGNKEGESGYGSLTRVSPATQTSPNQNRSSSSASSNGSPNEGSGMLSSGSGSSSGTVSASEQPKREHRVVFSDSESVVPIRPPRRKKKSSEVPTGNLKRYNSDDSVLLKMPHRRKSFKGNYQSQYSKSKKRVQISTPDETSSDSVNESIDQVLDRIINPGGMSFNDLKPSYQELILKIALTLTQDQLYQKSKQAMKKHQQFHIRKKFKHNSGEPSDDNSQFLNHLLKSFSKITSSKVSSSPSKRTTKSTNLNGSTLKPPPVPKVILKKTKEEEPFMSFCSGCMCEKCSDKCYCSLPSKHNVKIVGLPPTPSSSSVTISTQNTQTPTVEKGKKTCGYDTDSCAESEKCYCSLQRVKSNGLKIYNINLDTETSDTDTNSYDFEPFNQNETPSSTNLKTVSARSVEILSYHPAKRLSYSISPSSNSHLQTTNALVHFEDNPTSHAIHTSVRRSPNTRIRSSTASSYLQSSPEDNNCESPNLLQRNKILLITGSNPSTRVVYQDPHNYHARISDYGDGKKSRTDQHRTLLDITEDEDNDEDNQPQIDEDEEDEDGLAPEKVLSMKKTAEIAAMFTDLRLDQTTNIVPDLASDNYDSAHNTEDSNASLDFEASLGYLP